MLSGVGDERIHCRHCFYMAGRRAWRDSAAGGVGGAPWSREFAPHTRESLILPLRGANFLPGRVAGVCVSLRPTPGKTLFFRRGAQTFCREEPPAAEGVCAPFLGKPYSSVERRKPFAGKGRWRLCEFAPHSRESLIPPLRGANLLPGRAAGGCEGLRPTPGKALFFRQGAQTNCREEAPAAVWVCVSFPGKLYSSVEGANFLQGRAAGGGVGLRPIPRKALFFR